MTRAAIYCRVSTQAQEPGTSLESQRAACLHLADEIGAAVVAEYQDVDSGAKERIPGLLELTDAARRGDFDVVLVDHPDRFSRNLTKKVLYRRDLAATGVDIRYAAMRLDDTAEGRLMENMAAVISEYERERITHRTNRGRYAKARSGRVVGTGRPPYGYEYVRDPDATIISLQPDPITAPVVVRILTELLDEPARFVAQRLNTEGVDPPRGGKRWHERSILNMARNPVYSGRAAYGQWSWLDGTATARRPADEWVYVAVPPLLSRAIWDRLQDTLDDRRLAGRARLTDDPYVLRGTLHCGHCGGRLAAHSGNGVRYYVCLRHYPSFAARQGHTPQCALASLRADDLEALIIGSLRALLLDPHALRQGLQAEQRRLRAARSSSSRSGGAHADLERQQRRLRQIHDLLLDAAPATATWNDLRRRQGDTQAQITRLESELAHQTDTIATLDDATLETLEAFAASIRADLDAGGPESWQEILALYRVRVTARNAPPEHGWLIGRHAHFDLQVQADIPLKLLHRKNVLLNIATPRRSIPIPLTRPA